MVQSTPVLKYRETEGSKDIGTHFWSQGRTDEIRNRYVHLTDIPADGEELEETE